MMVSPDRAYRQMLLPNFLQGPAPSFSAPAATGYAISAWWRVGENLFGLENSHWAPVYPRVLQAAAAISDPDPRRHDEWTR